MTPGDLVPMRNILDPERGDPRDTSIIPFALKGSGRWTFEVHPTLFVDIDGEDHDAALKQLANLRLVADGRDVKGYVACRVDPAIEVV